jgi:hypothetical protein
MDIYIYISNWDLPYKSNAHLNFEQLISIWKIVQTTFKLFQTQRIRLSILSINQAL